MKRSQLASEDLAIGIIAAFVVAPISYNLLGVQSWAEALWVILNFPHTIFLTWYWGHWLLLAFVFWAISLEILRCRGVFNLVTVVVSALVPTLAFSLTFPLGPSHAKLAVAATVASIVAFLLIRRRALRAA